MGACKSSCAGNTAFEEELQDPVLGSLFGRPQVVEQNREPARALFLPFENRDLALSGKGQESSARFLSLNGFWRFQWQAHFEDLKEGFEKPELQDTAWAKIMVPSAWEASGFGYPIYVNTTYCFETKPPFIKYRGKDTKYNPTGAYRRDFELPEAFTGMEVFLHIGAAASAMQVWMNGMEVGYSTDSKLPAEFRVTEHVRKGKNVVAVKVVCWSSAAYMECADTWWFAGITRDVYLFARPRQHIRDVAVRAFETGAITIEPSVQGEGIDSQSLLAVELHDARGELTAKFEVPAQSGGSQKVANVKAWSAEEPTLYTLTLGLVPMREQPPTEVVRMKIGFRSVKVKDGRLLVNGKEVTIRGVNRSEFDAVTGRVISRESMKQDLKLIKQMNCNAVRNSHHPMDPYWYELCDEHGLYVVDEANIETHGVSFNAETTLAGKAAWEAQHLARVSRAYDFRKNHASVIIWSLGNEAGNGVNFEKAYDWIKERDARPVQYENAREEPGWSTNGLETITRNTDIFCPMYPSYEKIEEYARRVNNGTEPRPLIMCEYAHAMGNSLGGFKEYWDLIKKYGPLQGGFIWDWVDQGLQKELDGAQVFAFGGEYGPPDVPHNYNFCCNGLVQPDRRPNPHYYEAAYIMQPIEFEALDVAHGKFQVRNLYDFLTLAHLKFTWSLLNADGDEVASGSCVPAATAQTGPGEKCGVVAPVPQGAVQPGGHLLIEASYATNPPILQKSQGDKGPGHVVAWVQWQVEPTAMSVPAPLPSGPAPSVETGAEEIAVTSGKMVARISRKSGLLVGLALAGDEILSTPLRPNTWRPLTDNDYGTVFAAKLLLWKDQGKHSRLMKDIQVSATSGGVEITANVELTTRWCQVCPRTGCCLNACLQDAGESEMTIRYEIVGQRVRVFASFEPRFLSYSGPPRIGFHVELKTGFQDVEWYGRGPNESYRDRHLSQRVGKYKGTILEQTWRYVRPQENGSKWETRWMQLSKASSHPGACRGLLAKADLPSPTLAMQCHRFSLDDFDGPLNQQSVLDFLTGNVAGWAAASCCGAASAVAPTFTPEGQKPKYGGQLQPRPETTLCIDAQQNGLGCVDSWSPLTQPRPEYVIQRDEKFEWAFTLEPLG